MKTSRRILGVVSVCLVGIAAHQIWRSSELKKLEAVVLELREDGFPTRISDLVTGDPPEEENAGPLYEAAAGLLRAGSEEEAMDLALQAASRPLCVFGSARDRKLMRSSPPLTELMSLSELLCDRAQYRGDGNPSGSGQRDLGAVVAMGRHFGRDSILISQMLRIKLAEDALLAARPLLAASPDPKELLAALDFDECQGAIADGIAGEMVFVEWMMEQGALREVVGLGSANPMESLVEAVQRPGDLRSMRNHLLRLKESSLAARMPAAEGVTVLRRLEAEARDGGRVEKLASIATARLLIEEASYQHRLALTEIGVELLAAKNASGEFPRDLGFVGRERQSDPLTGAAMTWNPETGVLKSADGEDRWELLGAEGDTESATDPEDQ